MGKGNTNIIGLTLNWRSGHLHDSLRAFIFSDGKVIAVSAKIQPTLRQINDYLKNNGLRKDGAISDNHFQALQHRLQTELQSEYGLRTYKIQERLNLQSKQFNFKQSIEEFTLHKDDTGVAYAYRSWLLRFWLPFFLSKGCEHPKDFKQWKNQAVLHVKTAETKQGHKYSHNTYCSLTKPINEYMRFLREYEYISDQDVFNLNVKITLEQKKRGDYKSRRSSDTYTMDDLKEIKKKIDATYTNDLQMKLRAYALFFGVCTGLRRGNLMGMKVENLLPDEKTPQFKVTDNIVSGWSRGVKGVIVFENATKTTSDEDGTIRLPMLQPSREVLVDVTSFLKQHLNAQDRLIDAHPDSTREYWYKISKECNFKFLSPLQWRHSYATIGAAYLHTLYKGNIYFLSQCCLHSSVKMTEKYVNQKFSELLKAFEID